MSNQIIHPEKDYTIQQVGPSREWDFSGQGGKVVMKTYSIQLEGIADWVDLNQKADSDAPTVGEVIKGHVEDAGKYGLKFTKARKGGTWGGGKSSPGAIWSAAYSTAVDIVNGYYQASGTKPKDFEEFLSKIDAVAPVVRQKVDALAGTTTEKEEKTDSEAGESPAPAQNNGVVTTDVSDKDLGKW